MANIKLFITLLVAGCCMSSVFSADADWNVINTAIDDPAGSNPEVVKNSILNILRDMRSVRPAAAPVAAPRAPPVVVAPPPPVFVAPPPPAVQQAPAPQFQFQIPDLTFIDDLAAGISSQFQFPNFQPSQQQQQIIQQIPQQQQMRPRPQQSELQFGQNVVQLMPQFYPSQPSQQAKPCGKESVAEFMVNVPCPTSTPKPVREIVVKVPCPTTTEKPCACQCCPCSPCTQQQQTKKQRKAEVIYLAKEEEEPCKYPKSYKKAKKEQKKESKIIYQESSEEDDEEEVSSEESDEVEINPKPSHKEHKSIYTHFSPNVRSYAQPKKPYNNQPTIVYKPSGGGFSRVSIKEKKDCDKQ